MKLSLSILLLIVYMLLPVTLVLFKKGVYEIRCYKGSVLSYIYIGSFVLYIILSLHFSFFWRSNELENKEVVKTAEYVIEDINGDKITINGFVLRKKDYKKEDTVEQITKENKVEETVYKGYRKWLCFKVEDIEYEYIVK